jgi:hypothetical protein
MEDRIAEYFTGIEAEKRKAICSLMDEWRTAVAPALTYFRDCGEYCTGDAYFCADGFFPNYYNQKRKVLFIGRETRGMAGDDYDYIEEFLGFFKNDRSHTNFMRHILQMVQLFKSDRDIAFEQLLSANEYAKKMVKTGDYGFAVIDISKYSNDAKDGGKADWKLINKFLEDSHLEKRNYFQEELKILDPDYIITGNLLDGKIEKKYLDLCFNKLMPLRGYPKDSPEATLYEMDLDGKKVKLVDTWAFALPGDDEGCFYTPIKELLFPDRGYEC